MASLDLSSDGIVNKQHEERILVAKELDNVTGSLEIHGNYMPLLASLFVVSSSPALHFHHFWVVFCHVEHFYPYFPSL